MAKVGRPKGSKSPVVMGEEHRTKIRNSKILNRLIKHAEADEDIMSASQVSAAMGLLGFALPKLQPIDPATGKSGIVVSLDSNVKKT